jgi:hypothetical protein
MHGALDHLPQSEEPIEQQHARTLLIKTEHPKTRTSMQARECRANHTIALMPIRLYPFAQKKLADIQPRTFVNSMADAAAQPQKIPDRRADLDHRELDDYMKEKGVRSILTEMICYLVERRSEDHITGALQFLNEYKTA